MFFRNLTLFRFPTSLELRRTRQPAWPNAQLKPVGPLELSSRGFVSPFGRDGEVLSHRIARCDLADASAARTSCCRARSSTTCWRASSRRSRQKEGRKPGGRARKRLKDDLVHDLLPRAFVRPSRTDALLDLGHGVVVVDTSSRKIGRERRQRDPPRARQLPGAAAECRSRAAQRADRLDRRRAAARRPVAGRRMRTADPIDQGAVVKCQRQELQGDEIAKHLEAGKQVTRLALTLDDHVSFVLGEDLVVRKFKLLDGAVDAARIHRARRPARRTRRALRADGRRSSSACSRCWKAR